MFPLTMDIQDIVSTHVETVVHLSNTQKKKDVYFTVDVEPIKVFAP